MEKNKGGRPPKYKTVADMQAIIDQYFEDCKKNRVGLAMEPPVFPEDTITDDCYPAVTGLALVLNLSRQGLIEYAEKDKFSDTVKRAKLRVEASLEQRLNYQSPAGAIFNLKNNYNWKDKTEKELTGPNGGAIKTESKIIFEGVGED